MNHISLSRLPNLAATVGSSQRGSRYRQIVASRALQRLELSDQLEDVGRDKGLLLFAVRRSYVCRRGLFFGLNLFLEFFNFDLVGPFAIAGVNCGFNVLF